MSQNLFTQNTIAIIWDFDKTLSPTYMQQPLFRHYKVEEATFWKEVQGLERFYLERGSRRISKDTLYLNHILTYVRNHIFGGLNNALLRELGAEIEFYKGIPEFFEESKRCVLENPAFAKHGITVEHYIVSTGLREMIEGSKVGPFVDGVWGCEFVEAVAKPGYLSEAQPNLFERQDGSTIVDIGYAIDNTTKTRAIFEINKGTNKLPDIDVNATMAELDRRIPFQNMIYVADGPRDVPTFSIINRFGGATFAVYPAKSKREFRQVVDLQKSHRVKGIGEADYGTGSLTSMWLISAVEDVASRIVENRERLLSEKVGRPPRHITPEIQPTKAATVAEVARVAIDSAAETQTTDEVPRPAPPQPASNSGDRPAEGSLSA
jgi:hypothetical protein